MKNISNKIYVLDASAIIGGFHSKDIANFTTAEAILEIKDFKSSLLIQSALENRQIIVEEPEEEDLKKVENAIKLSGDILRLSEVDKSIIALALKLKRQGYYPIVVTDDFSMQNSLKTINIEYSSILTQGIKEIYNWIKICKGCKKKYPNEYKFEDCEICGSRIIKRRVKIKK